MASGDWGVLAWSKALAPRVTRIVSPDYTPIGGPGCHVVETVSAQDTSFSAVSGKTRQEKTTAAMAKSV